MSDHRYSSSEENSDPMIPSDLPEGVGVQPYQSACGIAFGKADHHHNDFHGYFLLDHKNGLHHHDEGD
jgi:hypothetical protein